MGEKVIFKPNCRKVRITSIMKNSVSLPVRIFTGHPTPAKERPLWACPPVSPQHHPQTCCAPFPIPSRAHSTPESCFWRIAEARQHHGYTSCKGQFRPRFQPLTNMVSVHMTCSRSSSQKACSASPTYSTQWETYPFSFFNQRKQKHYRKLPAQKKWPVIPPYEDFFLGPIFLFRNCVYIVTMMLRF